MIQQPHTILDQFVPDALFHRRSTNGDKLELLEGLKRISGEVFHLEHIF
jgi:hypothetical protein